MDDRRSYRLQPLDSTGVFLGLGAVQCVLLGVGVLLAALAVSAGLPIAVAASPVLAALVVSFVTVRGHVAWEWIPLAAGWCWSTATRGRRWLAPLALWPVAVERPAPLPPCLAGLELVEVPWRSDVVIAAVRNARQGTLTAHVPVRGHQFVLEDRHDQERLVAGWGDVLSQFATDGSPVAHLAWAETAGPGGLHDHLAWLPNRPRGDAIPPAIESYGGLLDAAAGSTGHDALVAVTVARDRLDHRARGSDALTEALAGAVHALVRGLASAGIDAGPPLDTTALYSLLRARVDPFEQQRAGAGRLADRLGLVTPVPTGPLAVEPQWRSVRVDGAWHRTWWVGSWPRLAVPPTWLEPFLATQGIARTMTVLFVPVSRTRSRRRIERDLVKLESDAATKEERGRRIDARHQRATEAVLEREQEVVAGFAEMAHLGLVTVAAPSEHELEQHAAVVEQHARESGLELRVLDGRQDIAWAASLPFGLAPATLLAT